MKNNNQKLKMSEYIILFKNINLMMYCCLLKSFK